MRPLEVETIHRLPHRTIEFHFPDAWHRISLRRPPYAPWTLQDHCVAYDVADHPSFNSSRLGLRHRRSYGFAALLSACG